MDSFSITTNNIEIDLVSHRNAGSLCTFIGTVRELTKGKRTLYLEYQAYEVMAEKMLRQIGEEIKGQFPEARVSIFHRIGRLEI